VHRLQLSAAKDVKLLYDKSNIVIHSVHNRQGTLPEKRLFESESVSRRGIMLEMLVMLSSALWSRYRVLS
jgi:hypothetical protein